VILILGRFSEDRKDPLEGLRSALTDLNFIPIIFDFQNSLNRSLTETVQFMAGMAHCVIADLTDASSLPQELSHIIPNNPSVPVLPIILKGKKPYSMLEHWLRYEWFLYDALFPYESTEHLVGNVEPLIVAPVANWKNQRTSKASEESEIGRMKEELRRKNELLKKHGIADI
jgi:hypothetical protein